MSTAWLRIIEPFESDRYIRGDRFVSWYPRKPEWKPPKADVKPRGKLRVTMKDLEPQEGRGGRTRLVGGPLDGTVIATHLYLRTGRGNATTHISMPTTPASFDVHTNSGERGSYVLNAERAEYWFVPEQGGASPAETPR